MQLVLIFACLDVEVIILQSLASMLSLLVIPSTYVHVVIGFNPALPGQPFDGFFRTIFQRYSLCRSDICLDHRSQKVAQIK